MNIAERARVHTQRELKAKGLGELHEQFIQVLFEHNPIGLPLRPGSRQDYGGPAGTLILGLGGVNSPDALRIKLYEEMVGWYGKDTGPEARYYEIAQKLWDLYVQFIKSK
jgi:hypothetical protein